MMNIPEAELAAVHHNPQNLNVEKWNLAQT